MSNALDNLNPAQKEAAMCVDQDVRIIAGAGSGKTRVLISRIEYLIEDLGIWPSRILAITFTNKAAREMKERLEAALGEEARHVRVSTIHSLCVRLLREDAQALHFPKDFAILDSEDQKQVLRPFYKENHIDHNTYPAPRVLSALSRYKREELSPQESLAKAYDEETQTLARFYEFYQRQLETMRAMDFDDLLINAKLLLQMNEDIRRKWQDRLDYIHVDEFQDVDPVQYDLIRLLKGPDTRLCVVGDPDQTIYTWRGASVDIILRFDRDFPDTKTVVLNENYRSTQPILGAANALIANNQNRIKKDLYSRLDGENLVVEFEGSEGRSEPDFIASQILQLHEEGIPYKDMAVLYRANYLSRGIENTLRKANIPYIIYGGIRFYERAEIKDILSYMRLLAKPDPEDEKALSKDLALQRIINVPKRGIGARTLEKLENEARRRGVNLMEAIGDGSAFSGAPAKKLLEFQEDMNDLAQIAAKSSLDEIPELILDYTGYRQMVKDANEEERLDNIRELQEDIAQALKENPDLSLEEYLQNISLMTDRQEVLNQDYVSLMTVHAAKGLEFPVVFVTNLNEGVFPSQRALDDNGSAALEEERRLLYVAMTRARKHLYLTWNTEYSFMDQTPRVPSRFIREVPLNYVRDLARKPRKKKAAATSSFSRHSARTSRGAMNNRTRFRAGDLIEHTVYGQGVIVALNGNTATVAFGKSIGQKKLNVQHPSLKKIS